MTRSPGAAAAGRRALAAVSALGALAVLALGALRTLESALQVPAGGSDAAAREGAALATWRSRRSWTARMVRVGVEKQTRSRARGKGNLRLPAASACSAYTSAAECARAPGQQCVWRGQGHAALLMRCETASQSPTRAPTATPPTTPPPTHRPTHSWAGALQCTNRVIEHIAEDACYDHASGAQLHPEECGCSRSANLKASEATYLIPPPPAHPRALTRDELRDKVVFVFIHVNKAAGETIKNEILFPAMKANAWDGSGLGTYRGWRTLGLPPDPETKTVGRDKAFPASGSAPGENDNLEDLTKARYKRTESVYMRCGSPSWTAAVDAGKPRPKCPLRIVWGALSMGLCDHLPGRPCVYFIMLRDPVSRAVSDYNYFCVEGQEGRHKWTDDWRRKGECTVNIVQYYQMAITPRAFYVERLTRACDEGCGKDAALANLRHPCMRYLLLDRLQESLQLLGEAYGPAMAGAVQGYLDNPERKNAKDLAPRTKEQLQDPELMGQLRQLLKDDIDLYRTAVEEFQGPVAASAGKLLGICVKLPCHLTHSPPPPPRTHSHKRRNCTFHHQV